MDVFDVWMAGRLVPDTVDRVRQYCGLRWSGGEGEVWAWPFYDGIDPPSLSSLSPIDVVAAAALHSSLTRADLEFFARNSDAISTWLSESPAGVALAFADDEVVRAVKGLPGRFPGVSVVLLTKVLHRLRPALIPLAERPIVDWYRPVTGIRAISAAWPSLIDALRSDLSAQPGITALADQISLELTAAGIAGRLSALRLIDIAIWAASR